jgi:hypothetical protein
MQKLGDRHTLRTLGEQLAHAMASPTLSPSDREAVAAALVCMAPVLERVPLPPSESPTIEIIFNVQLENWFAGRQSEVGDADDTPPGHHQGFIIDGVERARKGTRRTP